jgi:nicotinate-nucleotide pyrophosphorylase (carboxylating)
MDSSSLVDLDKIKEYLREDVGFGDITSDALIPSSQKARGKLFFREPGVTAGLDEASALFEMLGCVAKLWKRGGERAKAGEVLMEVEGPARALLSGERTAINIVAHMSGIATATAEVISKARKINPTVRVAATRKTLPGLRELEKRAVELGGGDTHRSRLDDCVLIKDNHLELVPSITEAVRRAKEKISFTKKIEVEARSPEQADEAARAGADIVMFDNMPPAEIRRCLDSLEGKKLRAGRLYEASGGITEENAGEYAASGVDVISLGSLTHSSRSLDVKLEIRMIK